MLDTFLEGACNKEAYGLRLQQPAFFCSSLCWTFVNLTAGPHLICAMFADLDLCNLCWS